MSDFSPVTPAARQDRPGSRWLIAIGAFLFGAVVGDLVGGGDWTLHRDRKNDVLRVLATQQSAWNRGDLDGFMDSYWKSDQLTFCAGAELTSGWRRTYDRYAQRYQGEGKEMGTLMFSEVEAVHADENSASARGRYQLRFRDGKTASGRFTLVLRRIEGEWKIVHDHTAADPNSGG